MTYTFVYTRENNINVLIFDFLYSRDSGFSLGYCHELRQTRNDFIGLSSGLAAAV